METLLLIITIIKKYATRLFVSRKIKLDPVQHKVIVGMANELNIPKEEVLWMLVEFGQGLAILSQKNEALKKEMNVRKKHLSEYKNWDRIAKLNYEIWKAGDPENNK